MPPTATKQPKPKVHPPDSPAAQPLPILEPSGAEAAFQVVAPRLELIAREQAAPVNVDVQVAAVFALGVSAFLTAPGVRTRFANLAKSGEYDDACVDELPTAAQAAWYARHRYLLETATRSEAQLPVALVDVAFALRGRMLKLAEYWLSDIPEAAAEIAAIRIGTGYQDLANDLIAFAALCERYAAMLSQDRKLYQAGDVALAKKLAGEILQRLGLSATAEQSRWLTAQMRAWTHLSATYEEVRRGGRFLFPGREGEERFPSLVTVARSAAARPVKDEPPAPAAEPPPAEPPSPPSTDPLPH